MTKEELKQKAYEYAIKEIPFIECITQNDLEILVQQAYITGAEPREKQIADLEEQLANADYQLEGRDNEIRELEAQIEKMQNCRNCKNEKIEGACGHFTQVGWCRDWKLAD